VSVLVDTSVWVDHLRDGDPVLADLLDAGEVWTHAFVIGEIALGHLAQRKAIIDALSGMPRLAAASDAEVIGFIEAAALAGRGIGYVDVHLLAALRLAPGTMLWTRDRRLATIAAELSLAADERTLRG
jgi:predicted nucleic acid-binding protein